MPRRNIQPITLTLSPKHIEMMVKTHRLKESDASEPGKIAQVAQELIEGIRPARRRLARVGRLGQRPRTTPVDKANFAIGKCVAPTPRTEL
jgi:hypothetical protein